MTSVVLLTVLYLIPGCILAACLPELKGHGQRASGFLLGAVVVLWGPLLILGSFAFAGWVLTGHTGNHEEDKAMPEFELRCPGGCHQGQFADFDHYCDSAQIKPDEEPAAFGAWLNAISGWDGAMGRVEQKGA